MIKTIITHPFAVLMYCLIIGSLLIFNNAKYADGTIPVLFEGNWSISLGFIVYAIGLGYVGYAIVKTIQKRKK